MKSCSNLSKQLVIEILPKYITNEFIINLLNLFDSQNTYTEDVNYSDHLFYIIVLIHNNKRHNDMSERLQVYSAI